MTLGELGRDGPRRVNRAIVNENHLVRHPYLVFNRFEEAAEIPLLVKKRRDTQDPQRPAHLVRLSFVFADFDDGLDATARGPAHPSPLGLAYASRH